MIGLLSAALAAAAVTNAPAAYNAAFWRADFAQLKAELQTRYVNLAWMGSYESGISTPSLARRTEIALGAAHSDAEARDALRAFVAGFHDGHLSELSTLTVTQATVSPEPERPQLDPNDPASGCAALGYASTASVAFSAPFESLPGVRLIGDGQDSVFRVGMAEVAGRRVGLIRIQVFEARGFPRACLRAWAKAKAASAPINRAAIRKEAGRLWLEDLAQQLKSLKAAGAQAVIVDVGANPGGDDSGDWIARIFAAQPLASSRLLVVDAPSGAAYLDEEIEDLTGALDAKPAPRAAADLQRALGAFRTRKASLGKTHCDLSWVWRVRRAWDDIACRNVIDAGYADGPLPGLPPHAYGDERTEQALAWSTAVQDLYGAWAGPTYVLTDRKSYSSAEMFAATLQNNGAAKVIGLRTGGDGCGFMGDSPPLVLTHSRMRFRVPNCIRLRADGTNEVAGITPDLTVAPVEGESDRVRAARILKTVVADLN